MNSVMSVIQHTFASFKSTAFTSVESNAFSKSTKKRHSKYVTHFAYSSCMRLQLFMLAYGLIKWPHTVFYQRCLFFTLVVLENCLRVKAKEQSV